MAGQMEDRRTSGGDLLRAVIDTVVDGLVVIDRAGVIRVFNPAAENLFGYTAREVIGLNVSVLMPEAERSRHDGYIENYHKTGQRKIIGIGREVRGRRKDGSEFPMNLAIGETRHSGEFAYVGIIRDVTEQKRVYAAMTEARMKAEVANNAKTEFLSRMSHELRTPMNAIMGFAQLLQLTDPEALTVAQRNDYLDSILGPARHLAALIDDVLDIARIEIGQLKVALRGVDLAEAIRDAIGIVQATAQRHGITVAADPIDPGLSPVVLADPLRLRQCLVNLVTNAIKYNRPGGEVSVSVAIRSSDSEGHVRLTVADTGIGIPEERLGELFVPFRRLHRNREDIEGVGIGLALVKQLVEAMRGTISVESKVGSGTRFHVDFLQAEPIRMPTHAFDRPGSPARSWASAPRPAGNGGKIALYVEDDPVNVHLMRTLFINMPQTELKVAFTGETCLAIADSEPVNLIILDINLPGIDGFETMHRLKNGHRTAAVPVIGLSSRATEQDLDRASELGFYRYFTKPMNVPEFMETVRAVL